MTEQEKIIHFIQSLPTLQQIEKEAGLPQGYMSKNKKWRKVTLDKVKKVVEGYGYK